MNLQLREASEADTPAIIAVATTAFGADGGPEIADLVDDLLRDPTAQPLLSLVAEVDGKLVGHVFFSAARIENSERPVRVSLLAPLAVHPEFHGQGIGGRLIRDGLELLRNTGTELVFVLGSPRFYPRFGFRTAGVEGFEAPHPIPAKNAEAWMVQELQGGVIGQVHGRVKCADAISDAKYWRE